MVKRILVLVLVVVLCIGLYMFWKQHSGNSTLGNGDVTSQNTATSEKDAMNAGATNIDGTSTEAHPTPSRSDAPGTINGQPIGSSGSTTSAAPAGQYPPSGAAQNDSSAYALGNTPSAAVPAGDSLQPMPPNGTVYSGAGAYGLYRQGNLTWRLDAKSGRYCIAFATMDEWAKPIVYNNGCGSGRG